MKKLLFLILIVTLILNIQARSSWKLIHDSETVASYTDIHCLDNMNCLCVGNGGPLLSHVLITSDGGNTWEVYRDDKTLQVFVPRKLTIIPPITNIHYLTNETIIAGFQGGCLVETTKNTLSWNGRFMNTDNNILDIEFIDNQKGAAFAYKGIYLTEDAGKKWKEVTSKLNIPQYQLDMRYLSVPDDGSIHIAGYTYDEEIKILHLRSTDFGNTWESFQFKNFDALEKVTGISFIDKNVGWMTGYQLLSEEPKTYNKVIYRTNDGGQSWELQLDNSSDPNQYLNGIYFAELNDGIAWGSGGIIWRTNNGGIDWIQDESAPFDESYRFRSLTFPEKHTRKIMAVTTELNRIWMYDASTSAEYSKDVSEISIYPNPADDVLNIYSEEFSGSRGRIVISDLTGRIITDKTVMFGDIHQINVEYLSSGSYLLSIYCEEKVVNKPFVIVK